MKIKELHIEKFRAILKCDIEFKDIMAIVGENNSGKTTILRALNAFFNFEEEEYFFINNMYQFAVNGQTGKVVGSYPVDKKKKWAYFAKIAAISYVITGVIAWFLLS